MFTSSLVEDAVNKAADIIDIPRSHVLPVKNYEKETILNNYSQYGYKHPCSGGSAKIVDVCRRLSGEPVWLATR